MFSRLQLERLHRHFVHPSAAKLHALLRRARPDSLPADTLKVLQDINHACHTCQTYSRKPMNFQVRFPDDVVFNQEVLLDLYWLDKRPALSIVDVGTGFCASRFLTAENVETVWNTFIEAWSLLYVGLPQSVLTDQGSVFLSAQWKHACDLGKIHLRHTGTESHNSLGSGEQIHSKLRNCGTTKIARKGIVIAT
jgi:transposase InsO family protein